MKKYEWSKEDFTLSSGEKRTLYRCEDFPHIILAARGRNERAVSICWWVSVTENMKIELGFGCTNIEKAKRAVERGNLEKLIDAFGTELR